MATDKDAKSPNTQFGSILKPLKAVLHGPPASGKTAIANRICRRYGAHYVSVKTMIEETLEDLRHNIAMAKETAGQKLEKRKEDIQDEEVEEEEEEEEEGDIADDRDIQQWEEQIRDINALLSQSPNNKLPDDYVVRLMRVFLSKDRCQSHGYVLDGFPKTLQQAKELFGQAAEAPKDTSEQAKGETIPEEVAGEGGDMLKVGGAVGNASIDIMPDFVISLQADDDFLCERVMRLPERDIQGTHYDEPNMIRRLMEFRENNTPDNTVLTFFDEADIHPILIDLMDEAVEDLECILKYLYNIFGPPIPGIGLSDEEEERLKKLEQEEQRLKQQAYMLEKQLAEEQAKKDYEDKMEKWAETLEKLQMEEEKIIAAETEPLRFYLMKYVFPTLTQGLLEVAKIRPDDPVDYLAEYLFKINPEGKMFDPSFNREGEDLLQQSESVSQNIKHE
ncbi:adenylate kinase 7-like [Sitophilus oryzae]|uniref:Adenylate kinase 7-like n=1 Tax=Sitophilus oryzae TaxID=7048 RepID=A0A6J2YA85_SITOR|nr:adenylate kinase 7-like [Sitophilus oryzae]